MSHHHEKIVKTARQTQRTVYLVAGLYVAIGLVLTAYSAIAGQVVIALVGLMIVSLAMGASVLLLTTLRLGRRVSAMTDRLERIDGTLDRVEQALANTAAAESTTTTAEEIVDLTTIGPGAPGVLVGAVLDRDRFPRLVATMDDAPHASSAAADASSHKQPGDEPLTASFLKPRADAQLDRDDRVHKDAMRRWRIALREGDLSQCREVFSMLVDVAAPELVADLEAQIVGLQGRIEDRLRSEFAARISSCDYVGALATGDEICVLLPDSRIARDFERIRPHLTRRVERSAKRQYARVSFAPG
jgi:hypothetical protein